MPSSTLERFTDRTTEEKPKRSLSTPSTKAAEELDILPDLKEPAEDGLLAFKGKPKEDIGSSAVDAKANKEKRRESKPKSNHRQQQREPATPDATGMIDAAIELNIEDIQDTTEAETKAVLLREAQIAANKLMPALYIGEQRRIREKTVNEQLEALGLGLIKARLENNKAAINEIRERQIPLEDESNRFLRYATAEEEVAARIAEMEASRDKLRAQKKRVSPIEETLTNLREVQTRLIESNTWEDPGEAAKRKRTLAYEELRLRQFKEKAIKEVEREKLLGSEGAPKQTKRRSSLSAEDYTGRREHLLKTLQKNIDDLAWAFDEKYGTSIEHVMSGEERLSDKIIGWWKDTRIGKLFSKKTEQYGGRDMNKQSMIEKYRQLQDRYKKELKADSIPGEKVQERILTERGEILERRALLRRNVHSLDKAAYNAIASAGELVAMPILTIAEPILRKHGWEKNWERMQSEHNAQLINEIAESILDKRNEGILVKVSEATGIAPWNLEREDIAEFFYITPEGEALREQLMKKLQKEMEQKERK